MEPPPSPSLRELRAGWDGGECGDENAGGGGYGTSWSVVGYDAGGRRLVATGLCSSCLPSIESPTAKPLTGGMACAWRPTEGGDASALPLARSDGRACHESGTPTGASPPPRPPVQRRSPCPSSATAAPVSGGHPTTPVPPCPAQAANAGRMAAPRATPFPDAGGMAQPRRRAGSRSVRRTKTHHLPTCEDSHRRRAGRHRQHDHHGWRPSHPLPPPRPSL